MDTNKDAFLSNKDSPYLLPSNPISLKIYNWLIAYFYHLKIYSLMKSFFLLCSFLFFANLSFGQTVTFKNNTSFPLTVGVQYTCENPNICPPSIGGSISTVPPLAPGDEVTLTLPAPSPGCSGPNRPYIIGAGIFGGGSESSQINSCWNPSCVTSSGPFTIVNDCSGSNTYITVD